MQRRRCKRGAAILKLDRAQLGLAIREDNQPSRCSAGTREILDGSGQRSGLANIRISRLCREASTGGRRASDRANRCGCWSRCKSRRRCRSPLVGSCWIGAGDLEKVAQLVQEHRVKARGWMSTALIKQSATRTKRSGANHAIFSFIIQVGVRRRR